jgi:single-stranded DNA-binding protein
VSDTYKKNHVEYEGRVFNVRDLRFTGQGNAVCSARMNINRKFDGEWHSVFFDLTAWDEAAEVLAECQDKDDVIVTGRLDVSKPYKKRDGTTVEAAFAITANKVERVGAIAPPPERTPAAVDPSDVPF